MAKNDEHKDEKTSEEEETDTEEGVEESDVEESDAEESDAEEVASDEDDSDDEEEASDEDDDSDDEEESSDEDSDIEEPDVDEVVADDGDDDEEEASDDDEEEASDDDEEEASDDDEAEASDDDEAEASDDDEEEEIVAAGGEDGSVVPPAAVDDSSPEGMKGLAAYFDLPDDLMLAAAHTRDSKYEDFEAFSPFPIHGMDDAMGLGRSWIPWVTFGAGTAGFLTANALQFGTMTFDWPMIVGGKPFAPWPAFVPIMFELTVLLAGCTTALVMLIAAGCFKKPFIIDREITQDRFVLWISADDESFDANEVRSFMESLDPVEIRTITKGA